MPSAYPIGTVAIFREPSSERILPYDGLAPEGSERTYATWLTTRIAG
jgi:hypothetical protein